MSGGGGPSRSWERDDCSRCESLKEHECPSLTSHSASQLQQALTIVLEREKAIEAERTIAKKSAILKHIAILKMELAELEDTE